MSLGCLGARNKESKSKGESRFVGTMGNVTNPIDLMNVMSYKGVEKSPAHLCIGNFFYICKSFHGCGIDESIFGLV